VDYLDVHLNRKVSKDVRVERKGLRLSGSLQSSHMDHLEIENISKALADEPRLRIFEAIAGKKEITCGELVSTHGVTPATISHHLKVLQEAGLIESRREGLFVYSRSMPGVIEAYTRALGKIVNSKRAKARSR